MSTFTKGHDGQVELIIPKDLTTFEDKLEYIEAVREALRLEHNERAAKNPVAWVSWESSVFEPRNRAVSIAKCEIMKEDPDPVRDPAAAHDGDDEESEPPARERIKQAVREAGDDHPTVSAVRKELQDT